MNPRNNYFSWVLTASVFATACNEPPAVPGAAAGDGSAVTALPYLGIPDVEFHKTEDGSVISDTIQYVIPKFSFTNQDGKEISHHDYEGHIFLVDYFFTNCKSICPVMSSQLSRIQDQLRRDQLWGDVMILSHTVDPDRDSPEQLKEYGSRLGADFSHWNFVTGNKDDLYSQAKEGYFLTAFPSDTAAGGFFHSDQVVLIDRYFHIRGTYHGTSTASMDRLYSDIQLLLHEQPADKP